MPIRTETPTVGDLDAVVRVLGEWQHDDHPFQLHPGDVGWFGRAGAAATAQALRVWRQHGEVNAVGLLDGPGLVRLAIAPELQQDEALARQLVADLVDPSRDVLPAGRVSAEAPHGALVQDRLGEHGWELDEPWTVLSRDLTDPVGDPVGDPTSDAAPDLGVRTQVVGPEPSPPCTALPGGARPSRTSAGTRWRPVRPTPQQAP